mmetsp:Transcript_33216/g.56473  ORF Transcript_33216/g.56473 Transcript_33216/m.56473 type:complete len:82 (+) Transcript_33216:740-985(+)
MVSNRCMGGLYRTQAWSIVIPLNSTEVDIDSETIMNAAEFDRAMSSSAIQFWSSIKASMNERYFITSESGDLELDELIIAV